MADLLEQSSAWLDGQRKQFLAKLVTYCRTVTVPDPEDEQGTVEVVLEVEVQATVGRTTFEIESSTGVAERFEARDFIITAADLVLDGDVVLPERGDRIKETVGSQTLVYEVVGPGNEPCWRWSDPYRLALRVHTKQVGAQ
jgi:hypothetical protein